MNTIIDRLIVIITYLSRNFLFHSFAVHAAMAKSGWCFSKESRFPLRDSKTFRFSERNSFFIVSIILSSKVQFVEKNIVYFRGKTLKLRKVIYYMGQNAWTSFIHNR